jgi:hypothetical protein
VTDQPTPPRATRADRLAGELDRTVGRTRLAWEATLLRADAARQAGDHAAVRRALDDQRTLLRDLHEQLDRAVQDATADEATPVPRAARTRGRLGALAGVGVVAALGAVVALSAPLGAPDTVTVADRAPATALDPAATDPPADGVVFDRVGDVLAELREVLARVTATTDEAAAEDHRDTVPATDEPGAAPRPDRSAPPPTSPDDVDRPTDRRDEHDDRDDEAGADRVEEEGTPPAEVDRLPLPDLGDPGLGSLRLDGHDLRPGLPGPAAP